MNPVRQVHRIAFVALPNQVHYGDENYAQNFQTVLQAIRQKRKLRVDRNSGCRVANGFLPQGNAGRAMP